MAVDFKLDRAGIRQLLKSSGTRDLVHEAARTVADRVNVDADIVVDDYTTDRVASSVTIKHPAALLWQVRDGALTRAAASVGLEVTEK